MSEHIYECECSVCGRFIAVGIKAVVNHNPHADGSCGEVTGIRYLCHDPMSLKIFRLACYASGIALIAFASFVWFVKIILLR